LEVGVAHKCGSILMQAIELDLDDATLYANRSLCHLRIGEANKALLDANSCIKIRPEWLKGYYRKGVALMSLRVRYKYNMMLYS